MYNILKNRYLYILFFIFSKKQHSISYLYSDIKKHTEAIEAITKSIEAQKKLGHDENKMQGWMHLGNIYYEAGRRIEAFSFYKKGLEVSKKEEHPLETASILNGMGKICAKEPDAH